MLQATMPESQAPFVILSKAKNPHSEEAWLRFLQAVTLDSHTLFVILSACLLQAGSEESTS